MPYMARDEHEEILNKLLDPEIEQSERTELLGTLRNNYNTTVSSFDEANSTVEKLQNDNSDLIISNSKLFRQVGIVGNEGKEKEVEEKEFSETVTLEQLEGEQ